jgi:polysaccharide pyruvyl transferase WcaK-like protein
MSVMEDLRLLSRKARARYIGYVGYGNLGDEAIYSATKELFADRLALYGAMSMGRTVRLILRVAGLDAVFLGGGTLVKGPSMHLRRLNDTFRQYPQAKFFVFGTGVEDADLWDSFGHATDKRGWRAVLGRSDYLAVRGPLSKAHLQEWGVTKSIHVIGDPSIWFARDKIAPKHKRKRIGLNLGPSRGQIHGRSESYVLEFGAQLLRLLHGEGWQISLFPVTKNDVAYLKEAVKMAGISLPGMHEAFLNIPATLAALQLQDVFVGEKLHSVALSSCVYTPAIMLEYRTKCRDFMLSINRQDWTYRTDDLDARLVFERLCELYENLDQHQAHIFREMQRCKASLRRAAAEIKSIVAGNPPSHPRRGIRRGRKGS